MIITRDVINESINFRDYDKFGYLRRLYDVKALNTKIDQYKNYLVDQGAKPGESVVIGFYPGLDQLAVFFAVCELGMSFTVNDYRVYEVNDDVDFIDTKTKMLMPISYFFDIGNVSEKKRDFFKRICDKCITDEDVYGYRDEPNDLILANPTDVLMRCTSSGTTGTPKLVEHTHEFLYNVSKRNSILYDNTVSLAYNFNHGSSLATYFIPALMSKDVTQFTNFSPEAMDKEEQMNWILDESNHLMLPYTLEIDQAIKKYNAPNLTYYTLGTIDKRWRDAPLRERFKDVVSIFGCNETSGPLFINRASYKDFETNVYHVMDDYYEFESISPLVVKLKEYGTILNTKDNFEKVSDTGYRFNGRTDLIRINGTPVHKSYNDINKWIGIRASLVYDTVYNEIYLCLWYDGDEDKYSERDVREIFVHYNNKMKEASGGKHFVSKVKITKMEHFIAGVKQDNELLRSYFREKVDYYA